MLPYFLSSGPRNDRFTYETGNGSTATPYERIARISGSPCILQSLRISFSGALAGTFWVLIFDMAADVSPAAGQPGLISSAPIQVAGSVFVFEPTTAEEVETEDPEINADCGQKPVKGFPFDKGLVVALSGAVLFQAPGVDLMHVTARVRQPAPPRRGAPSTCNIPKPAPYQGQGAT